MSSRRSRRIWLLRLTKMTPAHITLMATHPYVGCVLPQHFLYLRPLPQGQGSLRPTLRAAAAASGRLFAVVAVAAAPMRPGLPGGGAAHAQGLAGGGAAPRRARRRWGLLGGAALLELAAGRLGRSDGRRLRDQPQLGDAPHQRPAE